MAKSVVKSHSRSVKGKGNTSVKRHARTVKKGGKWVSEGHHTEMMAGRGRGKNINQKINDRLLEMDEMSMGRKAHNINKARGNKSTALAMFNGKAHSQSNDILNASRKRRVSIRAKAKGPKK